MTTIQELATRQLDAYNRHDLDAFVACYHPDVEVWDGDTCIARGRTAFSERYTDLFTRWQFGATVPQQVHHGPHCIDLEDWWRVDPESGERTEGRVLVHYTQNGEHIGTVRFLD